MFTDIVGSTSTAAKLGDRQWRQIVARHHSLVRQALKKHKGRELDTAGDGFFASFDQPGRAIACAVELTRSLRSLGIDIRAGVHMGEVEVMGPKVGGIAVHVGSRVMSMAGPGEVWVSSTVRDLIAGSDVRFEDRGVHELKGIPAQWRLYSVASEPLPEGPPEEPGEGASGKRSRLLRPPAVVVGGVALVVVVAVVAGLLIREGKSGPPSSSPPVGLAAADRVARISNAASGGASLAGVVPVRAGGDPSAIAVGEGSIWVANRDDGTVSRIDPVTNESTTIEVGIAPYLVAVGEGSVWAVNRLSRSVSRIDPGTDEVVATIGLGGPGFPSSIAVGEGAVWVGVNQGFDPSVEPPAIHRIDPQTNGVVTSIELSGTDGWAIVTAGEGVMWAAGYDGRLFRVDPRTNELQHVASLGVSVGAITFGDGALWIASTPGGILRVDPATGSIEATVPGGGTPEEFQSRSFQDVQLGMTFADGIIWVTGKLNGTIDRIVANGNSALQPINVGQTPTGVAVGYGSVWVTVDTGD
jgi:YVTN family beta-propeller protein